MGEDSGHSAKCQDCQDCDLLMRAEEFAPKRWVYQNLTPWRIHAAFAPDGELQKRGTTSKADGPTDVGKVLSIPALGEKTVPRDDARHMNTLNMRRLGQVEVRPASSEFWTNLPPAIMIYGWLAVGLFFGAWALFFGGATALPWPSVVAAVIAVPVLALVVATWREVHLYRAFSEYAKLQEERAELARPLCSRGGPTEADRQSPSVDPRLSLEGVERASQVRSFVAGVPRHAAEVAVLIGAVFVSVVGLGIAIHLTTQLNDLIPIDYGSFFQLDDPFADVGRLARRSPAFWQLLVGHVAQWVLVAVAALVPAAMYFQFDRQRLASVRRRWIHEVFRLDPTVRTVRDIEAKYSSQIESSFGDPGPDSGLRLGGGRRSPVIVATILLVVGWFLIISTTEVPTLEAKYVPSVDVEGATARELVWPGDGKFPVKNFFRPDLSPAGYAFLGAYVFTLFHIIRGYQRRDLHPKAYNTVVVRILAAYALGLVVSVVNDGPRAEVLMFFVGFTPESALVWLRERLARGKWLPLQEHAPLTDLEGIDLYDRTRLAEEGITNIEGLAHADIVSLMSSTRISAAQLVDWTDQAILYLHVGGDAQARQGAPKRKRKGPAKPRFPAPDVHQNLARLRFFGIRTASDLVQAYNEASGRDADTSTRIKPSAPGDEPEATTELDARQAGVRALGKALEPLEPPELRKSWSVHTVIETLSDEEWFVQIGNWRTSEFDRADTWYWYLDGHDWRLTRAEPQRPVEQTRRFTSVSVSKIDFALQHSQVDIDLTEVTEQAPPPSSGPQPSV